MIGLKITTPEELEQEAEKKCVLNDKIHRDCYVNGYITGAVFREKKIVKLEKKIVKLEKDVKLLGERCNQLLADKGKLTDENTELKVRIGLSIECEKAQKNGELCLGYAGDEDEPCERCKNCIKCECGYYQLGETEKDEQLNKAKELIEDMYDKIPASHSDYYKDVMERA